MHMHCFIEWIAIRLHFAYALYYRPLTQFSAGREKHQIGKMSFTKHLSRGCEPEFGERRAPVRLAVCLAVTS